MIAEDLVGSVLADRFEIISLAGSGGMGHVYRAKQVDLGRTVAIKILDPSLVSDEEMKARFLNEAQSLSTLKHEHIAAFYSFGITATRLPFIAMEFLEGISLRKLIEAGPINADRVIAIASQIAAAMQHAHEVQIVHRDLKPENVLLLDAPYPDFAKIVDFGFAKNLLLSGKKESYTATGDLIGTPKYFSPEQCRGEKSIDARGDIYALGCIMYEMLLGVAPFEADYPVAIIHKHLQEEPAFSEAMIKSEPQKSLCRIIKKCLGKEREDRYQTMELLLNDLSLLKARKFNELSCADLIFKPAINKKMIAAGVAALMFCCLLALVFKMSGGQKINEDRFVEQQLDHLAKIAPSDANSQIRIANEIAKALSLKYVPLDRDKVLCDIAEKEKAHPAAASQLAKLALLDVLTKNSAKVGSAGNQGIGVRLLSPNKNLNSNPRAQAILWEENRTVDASFLYRETVQRSSKILLDNDFALDHKTLVELVRHAESITKPRNVSDAPIGSYFDLIGKNAARRKLEPSSDLCTFYWIWIESLRDRHMYSQIDSILPMMKEAYSKYYGSYSAKYCLLLLSAYSGENSAREKSIVREAYTICLKSTDKLSATMAEVCERVATALRELGEYRDAVLIASKGLAMDVDDFHLATLYQVRARANIALGKKEAALKDAESSLALHRRVGRPFERAGSVILFFEVASSAGHKEAAEEVLKNEIKYFEEQGYYASLNSILENVAMSSFKVDPKLSEKYVRKALEVSKLLKSETDETKCRLNLFFLSGLTRSSKNDSIQPILELLKDKGSVWSRNFFVSQDFAFRGSIDSYVRLKQTAELKKDIPILLQICNQFESSSDAAVRERLITILNAAKSSGLYTQEIDAEIARLKGAPKGP